MEKTTGSPFPALPAWLNSELYVRVRKLVGGDGFEPPTPWV